MKKFAGLLSMVALVLALTGSGALAEYVSITELRASIPERWQGEYTTKEGAALSIDVPIIVPEAETVPAVRITWGGAYSDLSPNLLVEENNENHLVAEFSTASNQAIRRDQAAETYVQRLREAIPAMRARELENYMLIEESGEPYGKRYRLAFYSTFHHIPYLIGQSFRLEAAGEAADGLPPVPANVTQGNLLEDRVGVTLCAAQELGVDVEDLPLLPFERILPVFEQWVTDGYVYSLDEMRLGYMAFLDPAQKGKEFVLLPVWVAKGITRGQTGMPFYPDEDSESALFTGYMNPTVCAVNAQTGQKYDFVNDSSEERRYVPTVLTWAEAK